MKLLGIETSTQTGSVAVVEDKEVIAEYTLNIKETHTARIMPAIDRILKDTHLTIHQMDAVAVSLGPGSFTGLRIGIATAKGLCSALRKPFVGIPTLDAFARNIYCLHHLICPLLDARRGEVYAALYRYRTATATSRLEKLTGNLVLPLEELLVGIDGPVIFLGSVPAGYRDLIREKLEGKVFFAPPYLNLPRAANVAVLGVEKLESGEETDPRTVEPLYVRRPEAEVKWEERHRK